jgi:hypothetical protein
MYSLYSHARRRKRSLPGTVEEAPHTPVFAPGNDLRLLTPEGNASTYLFNKHAISHRFCPTCGIHPHGEGTGPDGKRMAAVNLRCVQDLDLAAIPVQHVNGRAS